MCNSKKPTDFALITKKSRRDFLKLVSMATTGAVLGPEFLFKSTAYANQNKPFCLILSLGSFDGWSSGLFMPQDVGVYPKGVFYHGQHGVSLNPNINIHYKVGEHVYTHYMRMLVEATNQVTHAVIFPRSLSHGKSMAFQLRGSSKNTSFLSGFAQAHNIDPTEIAVINAGGYAGEFNNQIRSVSRIAASNIEGLRDIYKDATGLPKNAHMEAIWRQQKDLNAGMNLLPHPNLSMKNQLDKYSDLFYGGIPPLIGTGGQSIVPSIESQITLANVHALIDNYIGATHDGTAVKAHASLSQNRFRGVFERLRLAAIMIQSGIGSGMHIGISSDQDWHDGFYTGAKDNNGQIIMGQFNQFNVESTNIQTARESAAIMAAFIVFWNWVKTMGYQDRVLGVVHHEFGRTAYNNRHDSLSSDVMSNGVPVAVNHRGTDHAPAAGYLFFNGQISGNKRFGGISDNYAVFGSNSDGKGIPNPAIPAYHSSDVFGSLFMRLYPDRFSDLREMQKMWPDFKTIIPGLA